MIRKTLKQTLCLICAGLIPGGGQMPLAFAGASASAVPSAPAPTTSSKDWGPDPMGVWIPVTSLQTPVCGQDQAPYCRAEDCRKPFTFRGGDQFPNGNRAPIYCWISKTRKWSSRGPDTEETYAVLSSYELTLRDKHLLAVRRNSDKEESHAVKLNFFTREALPSSKVIVHLAWTAGQDAPQPSPQSATGAPAASSAGAQPASPPAAAPPATLPGGAQQPAPPTQQPTSPVDERAKKLQDALGKLFNDKVERTMVEYLRGQNKLKKVDGSILKEEDVIEAGQNPSPEEIKKFVDNVRPQVKTELDDLFYKGKGADGKNLNIDDPKWLEKADPKRWPNLYPFLSSSNQLGKDAQEQLLRYFCRIRPRGEGRKPPSETNYKSPSESIRNATQNFAEMDASLRSRLLDTNGSPEARNQVLEHIYDRGEALDAKCWGRTETTSSETETPTTRKPARSVTAERREPPLDNKPGSPSQDNSELYKMMAGAGLFAVVFGLFGMLALGPLGMAGGFAVGAIVGAVVGAATVRFTIHPFGEKDDK